MTSGSVPLLAARGITKRFFGALALDAASFDLRAGEIHALIGENGAGKSTFIKILAGVYQADGGEILLDGKAIDPAVDALPLAFVHQDLALVDDLSVGENIALIAGYPRKRGLIDWQAVMRQVAPLYAAMNVEPFVTQAKGDGLERVLSPQASAYLAQLLDGLCESIQEVQPAA